MRLNLPKRREEVVKLVGMHCATCAITIQKALENLGVEAEVSFASEEARIIFDPTRVPPKALVEAVRRAGYDIYKEEAIYVVKGLSSSEDAARIESFLLGAEGVFEASANHVTGTVRIIYNPANTSPQSLRKLLQELGLKIVSENVDESIEDPTERLARQELRVNRLLLAVSLPPTVALMILTYTGLGARLGGLLWPVMALLAIPPLIAGSARFLRPGIRALVRGRPNMDSLVILGTYSAFIGSLLVLLGVIEGHPFFEASAAVMTFILAGKYLEANLKAGAGEAVRRLAMLQPRTAHVLRDGEESEVPIGEVRVGDRVLVRPGDRVPVDGVIVEGRGFVDESLMTGEPMPVEKGKGSPVVAGSVLVSGSIVVHVTRVGRDTFLSQMIRLVRTAQAGKPRLQSTVDRVSGYFTWLVIGTALASLAYWYFIGDVGLSIALSYAVAVLVVACPCALGLAIPMAVVAGFGRAAELGLLVKDPSVIDRLPRASLVVFDKTGTLTEGRPRVRVITPLADIDEETLLSLAASAELRSEHPIGKAIVLEAKKRGVPVREPGSFESFPGMGVLAVVWGRSVAVGGERMMEQGLGLAIAGDAARIASHLRSSGYTVVYVAVDGSLAGIIGVGDEPRPEARGVIEDLKRRGLKVAMLTGDHEETARAVAMRLGIDLVVAGATPEKKAELVESAQGRGETVVMVGDGVNDAPALSRADIGIAVGGRTDIAEEAGDIVIVRGGLRGVVTALELVGAVRRKAVENLAWAFTYNSILIPVAAGALSWAGIVLRPEIAGLAMAMSSVTVSGWAQTLRRWMPRGGR